MDLLTRSQTPPNSASTTGTKRTRLFLPLSNHGMPRTPLPISPGGSVRSQRSHRFNGMGSPSSPPLSAGSPPPSAGSPPLSARTFTTFYGSEPNLSPQAPSHFSNSSTLVSSSPSVTPSLPPVPKFDNIDAIHAHRRSRSVPPTSPAPEKDQPSAKDLPPNSIEPTAPAAAEDDSSTYSPLTRLAQRIRTILSSKQSADKRAENRRRSKEAMEAKGNLARVEQMHWTEM
jgi:hypothetical protein